jgi:L,D-peptidoglycan transpeptidase YkuD (ErfK/YbiS/YcfS/YnhG family)
MMEYIKKNKWKVLIGMGVIIIALIGTLSYSENKKNILIQEFRTYLASYKDETEKYILDGKEEQYQTLSEKLQVAIEEEEVNELSNLKGELEILKESIIEGNVEFINNKLNELNIIDISVLQDERKNAISIVKGEIEELIEEKKYKEAKEKLFKLIEEINNEIVQINTAKDEAEKAKKEEEEKIVEQEVIQEPKEASTGSYVSRLKVANETDQILIVKGDGGSSVTVEYHVKSGSGVWNEVFSTWGYVGQNGITYNKVEGDRKTPAGTYNFGTAFGIASNPGTSIPYMKITNNDVWVDDPNSKYYNKGVKGDIADKDWNSAEQMIKYSAAYKYGIVINYNTYNTIKGKGSAIFLHCATQPTAGCVSIPENYMIKLLQSFNSSTRIVIANGDDIYNF